MHILIIEDEKQLCQSIAEGLRMDGYEADTCFDGADGHDLGSVDSALGLNDAALLALTAGLDVLGNHVLAFNDDLAFSGADLQDLTSVALVLAADDHHVVAGFNMKIIHF